MGQVGKGRRRRRSWRSNRGKWVGNTIGGKEGMRGCTGPGQDWGWV